MEERGQGPRAFPRSHVDAYDGWLLYVAPSLWRGPAPASADQNSVPVSSPRRLLLRGDVNSEGGRHFLGTATPKPTTRPFLHACRGEVN